MSGMLDPMYQRLAVCLAGLALAAGLAAFPEAASAASRKQAKKPSAASPAAATALQYAEALSKGDTVTVAKLDFACQYRLVAAAGGRLKSFPAEGDPSYEACAQTLKSAHAAALEPQQHDMDILWPSAGGLVFIGDDMSRYPASVFVMDVLGQSPPGTGLNLETVETRSIPSASFRLRANGPVVGVPTSLVKLRVTYRDPLTAPAAYAPGTVKWTNTIKKPRVALKSVEVQWVVLSGLKKHGFAGDRAIFNLPVTIQSFEDGVLQDAIPFATETSRALRESFTAWKADDMPGTLIAAAARAAAFPDLHDRVAMLNRILIIDPNQPDALTVLSRDLFAMFLKEGGAVHKVAVKDPGLGIAVNELYWNTYAHSERTDLSLPMEMGGFTKPTPADYLYRMIPAMEALAKIRPQALDNRFRLGIAYRWNNDQRASIATHEALVKDIPPERKAAKAEALLQLAWSRIVKAAWNRIAHDPDVNVAYQDAEQALALADQPLDKFLAEYTMAYATVLMPNRDKADLLRHLNEAKRWYAEVPGRSEEVWRFFIGQELLHAVMEADPAFKPLLATTEITAS